MAPHPVEGRRQGSTTSAWHTCAAQGCPICGALAVWQGQVGLPIWRLQCRRWADHVMHVDDAVLEQYAPDPRAKLMRLALRNPNPSRQELKEVLGDG